MQPKFVKNIRFNNQKAKNRFVIFISKNLFNLILVVSAGVILTVVAILLAVFRSPDSAKAAGETVQFSSSSGSILESVGQTGIPITLSQAIPGNDVTVSYTITGGTAVQSVDYSIPLSSSTITFVAGKTSQTIPIKITNDTISNSNKTVTLTLSSPSGAVLGTTTNFTLTILDDDAVSYSPFGESNNLDYSTISSLRVTSGLKLQLDAQTLTGNNGDKVLSWSDSSGNNNNLTQAVVTAQPTLIASSGNFNNKKAVRFDGVGNFFSSTNSVITQQSTIISLTKANINTSSMSVVNFGVNGAGNAQGHVLNINYFADGGAAARDTDTGVAFSTTNAGLFVSTYDGATVKTYVNSTTSASAGRSLTSSLTTGFRVGRSYTGSLYFNGDIAEILVYDRPLSTSERQNVECYLSGKYALALPICTSVLKLHLDASSLAGTDGSVVSNWNDLSGNNNNAIQGTVANQPILRTGANGLNNRNVVRFDSVNDAMTTPLSITSGDLSVLSVYNYRGILSLNRRAIQGSNNWYIGPTTLSHQFFPGVATPNPLLVTQNQFVIQSSLQNSLTGASNFTNGTLRGSVVPTTYPGTINLGASGSTTNPLDGDIAEVVVFSSFIPTFQKTLIENYLAIKYGLPISNSKYIYSATHPNQIIGIGLDVSNDGVLLNSSTSNGFYLSDSLGVNNIPSLSPGESVLAGNDGGVKTLVDTNLPAGIAKRWNRTWAIDKTKTDGVNIKVGFDFSEYAQGVPQNAANYRLLYRATNSGNFATLATTSPVTITNEDRVTFTLTDTELQDGYYTIGTTSETNSPLSVPSVITNLVATTGNAQVSLSWSAVTEAATDYIIQYSDDNFATNLQVFVDGVNTVTSGVVVNNLNSNIKYAFRVLAVNNSGTGNSSNITVATTTSVAPSISSISPENKGSTMGGYDVTLNGSNFISQPIYKRTITINNSIIGNTALTDYQISLTLDTASLILAGKMRPDCGDFRVVDSDDFTGLPYWIESGCNTTNTIIWIKVSSVAINSSKDIYLKYGDLTRLSSSNGDQVFDFFDGFDGNSIDTLKWTVNNATGFSVASGQLRGTNTSGRISSKQRFSSGIIQEIKSQTTTIAPNGQMVGGFYLSSSNGLGWLNHPVNAYYRNDGNWISKLDQTPNNNLLYTIKVKNSTTANLNIFNLDTNTDYWNVGDVSNNVSNEPIVLGARYDNLYTGQTYQTDWDYLRVRKYALVEPVVSTGTEQSSLATTINFGTANLATNIQILNSNQIKATVPASNLNNAGINPKVGIVVVTLNQNGQTATTNFEYVAPLVTNLSPNSGPTFGGTNVSINGNYFNGGGGYYQKITITNTDIAQSDFQVSFTLNTSNLISTGKMRPDCGDLRVKDTDLTTNLSYWIESGCNTTTTIIWTKVSALPTGAKDIYITYGSPTLTAQASLSNVFLANQIYQVAGNCTNTTLCSYADNHAEFDSIRAFPTTSSGYTTSINDSTGGESFFRRYRFLYVPTISTTTTFGVNTDDAGEATFVTGDNYGSISSNIHSLSQHDVVASWYGPHGAGTCGTSGILGSRALVANQGYWVDFMMEEWGGGQLAQMCINDTSGYKIVSTANFSDKLFSRKYASSDPSVSFDTEKTFIPKVYLGGILISPVTYLSSNQLQFTTPPNLSGQYAIKVVAPDGTESNTNVNFTYLGPVVTAISPSIGSTYGGMYVTITGNNFYNTTTNRYIRTVQINNNTGGSITNYLGSVTLNTQSLITAGKMRSDCGDLRLKNENNSNPFGNTDTTNLLFFQVQNCNTATTTIRFLILNLPVGYSNIYLTYGDNSLTNQSFTISGPVSTILPVLGREQFMNALVGNKPIYDLQVIDNQTIKGYLPSGTNLVGVTVTDYANYSGTANNLYTYTDAGLSIAITPPGGAISFDFGVLTVKAQDQATNTGNIPVTITDTRSSAQGWTSTCQFSRDFEMTANPQKKLALSQRMTNQPQNIQNTGGQSTNLNLGTNTTISAINTTFSLAQAGSGSGAGSTVIDTKLQYSLPAYSLAGQYQTSLVCTVI